MKSTAGYQVIRKGQAVQVNNLTIEELREELAIAIDAIEELANFQERSANIVKCWQESRPIPNSDEPEPA